MSNRKPKKQSDKLAKQRLQKLLKAAAALSKKIPDNTPTRTEYAQLANIASEFLDCYVILGFNPEGYTVQIVQSHNPKETNSLINLLHVFLERVESGEDSPPPEAED